jgi:hypothetical protein
LVSSVFSFPFANQLQAVSCLVRVKLPALSRAWIRLSSSQPVGVKLFVTSRSSLVAAAFLPWSSWVASQSAPS